MKVITEEDVNFICSIIAGVEDRLGDLDKRNIIALLLGDIQEIDTLTVSKLRPMADSPRGEYILVKTVHSDGLIEAVASIENSRVEVKYGSEIDYSECVGWIPMPIYKPEKE